MDFELAPDIQQQMDKILAKIDLEFVDPKRIVCFRSFGSKSRAIARIWSLPRIWQIALKTKAHYCVEVITHHFDKLSQDNKTKVLIHELLHIPKNFSGALLPHRARFKTGINRNNIERLFRQFKDRS